MPPLRQYIPLYVFVFAVLSAPLSAITCVELSERLEKVFAGHLDEKTGKALKYNCKDGTAEKLQTMELEGRGCFTLYPLGQAIPVPKAARKLSKSGTKVDAKEGTDDTPKPRDPKEPEVPIKAPEPSKAETTKQLPTVLKAEVVEPSNSRGTKEATDLEARSSERKPSEKKEEVPSAEQNRKSARISAGLSSKRQRSRSSKVHNLEEIAEIVNKTLTSIPAQLEKLKQCATNAESFDCSYKQETVFCYFNNGAMLIRNPNLGELSLPLKEAQN